MNRDPYDNEGYNAAGYDENGEHDRDKQTDFEPEDSDYEGGEPEDTYVQPELE